MDTILKIINIILFIPALLFGAYLLIRSFYFIFELLHHRELFFRELSLKAGECEYLERSIWNIKQKIKRNIKND